MRAATIGRTQPHSEPQRWLPAQCTTPTIGQPTASRTDPHRHRPRLYTMRAATIGTRCGSTIVHTPTQGTQAHTAPQRASAMATGTMYHTHHRTASAGRTDPHRHRPRLYTMRAATIGQPQRLPWYTPHTGHTGAHRQPQRLYTMRAATIGQPQRLPWYTPHTGHTGAHRQPQRGAHTDRTGHRLRLYAMYARTHTHRNGYSGRTEPHRWPQHMLPAQYTIERETARLSLYHGTHPPSDSLSTCYRHNVPSSERQRASASTMVHSPTGARIPIGQPQRWLPAQCTHTPSDSLSGAQKIIYKVYKIYFATFFFPSKIAETFSRICK